MSLGASDSRFVSLIVALVVMASPAAAGADRGDAELAEVRRWLGGVIEQSSQETEFPGLLIELSMEQHASRSEAEFRELKRRAEAFPESDAATIAEAESRRRTHGPDTTRLVFVWGESGRWRVHHRFVFPSGTEMEGDAVLLGNKMWTSGGDRASIKPFVDPPYSGQDPRQQYAYRVQTLRFLASWGLLHTGSAAVESYEVREEGSPGLWIADVVYAEPSAARARVSIRRDQGRFAISRIDRPAIGDRAASSVVLGEPVSIGESGVVVPSSVERFSASGRRELAVRLVRAELLDRRTLEQVFTEPALGVWHDPIRERDVRVSLLVDYRRDPPRVTSDDPDRPQRLVLQGRVVGVSDRGWPWTPLLIGVVIFGGVAALAGYLVMKHLRR